MWETNDLFGSLVEQEWENGMHCNTMKDLHEKLAHLGEDLRPWGETIFGSVRRELRETKKHLAQLRADPLRTEVSEEEKKVVDKIVMLNIHEQIMWKQRSRIEWLREGDSNTAFFHQSMTTRHARNRISRLQYADGSECVDLDEMHGITVEFYKHLYTFEGTTNMQQVLNHVPRKVSDVMNQFLCAPFCKEVKTALFQMFSTKAPGPDGLPTHFFQRYWDVCGDNITRLVLSILNGDASPDEINSLFIVLIPKVQDPVTLSQF